MAKLHMENTQHSLITDGVDPHDQTLAADKPFWVFFVGNIGVATWLMGVVVAGMGIGFYPALCVLLLGSIVGSLLPASMAMIGPMMRLSQMEVGRLSLGLVGKKLSAFLNWMGAVGYDVSNNVLSAAALVSLLAVFGVSSPFWVSLAVLVGIQLVIGIYGHHLIQDTSKYTGALLGVFFLLIGLTAIHKTGVVLNDNKSANAKDILSAFLLIVVVNVGSTPYACDYTRYLPQKTPHKKVFIAVFGALFLSLFVLSFFGYLTAAAISEQTPEGVMKGLQGLTGIFAPVVLFLVAFNSIPVNAVNDNSAAYSLMSAGFKLSRPVSAIVGAVLGYGLCLFASASFIEFFENFLFLFAHWIAPWAAIILVHWFVLGRAGRVVPSNITMGGIIFVVVTVLSVWLFSANTLYTGLLSDAVGGVDIGPYIGFIVAGLVYYAALRFTKAKR